jgi:hypothetical protein
MATINKYQIRRYKEVLIDVPAGIVEDGGFSTFQLDNPDMILNPPNGTSDFFGTIKKVVLLGEVIKETLDTGNVGIGQFNQLTQQDFQNQLNLGTFVYNKDNGGRATVIGWVELGETYPSFYYEDCVVGGNNGKRPVSENYYDLDYFDVSPYTVSGEGIGQAALQQTGNWNYGDSIGNWGPLPFPRQENLTLDRYMIAVLNGGEIQGVKVTELRSNLLGSIPVLISDYEEHFLGNNSKYTLSPSFANNNGNSRVVYARIRRTISSGFRPSTEFQKNSGGCISIGTSVSNGNVTGVDTGIVSVDEIVDINFTDSKSQINTEQLLERNLNSLLRNYPGFRYNKSLMTDPQSVIFFDNNFPEMDSIKHSIVYRFNQELSKSVVNDILNQIDSEIKRDGRILGDSELSSQSGVTNI